MGEIVNLRRVRRAKSRAEAAAAAEARRRQFGEGKAARTVREAETRLRDAQLDGARLETPPERD